MTNRLVGNHFFLFNKSDNGGESLSLRTQIFDNGDGEVYVNQKFQLQSYCNQASIELYGASLTPDLLRELANELEKAMIVAKLECRKK